MPQTNESSVSKRKTAKQERSRAKVQLILDTTMQMLNEGPADKISTNEIAKRAGISIGTLYQYFPKKEGIYYELYKTWLTQTLDLMDKVDTEFEGNENLDDYADAMFDALSRDKSVNSKGHWQLRFTLTSSPELVELEQSHFQKVFERIMASQRKFSRTVTEGEAQIMAKLRHSVAVACLSVVAGVQNDAERDRLILWCKKTLRLVYDIEKLNA